MNNIYNEDCFVGMKSISDKSINLILTDPPYGCTACKWDVKIDVTEMFNQFNRIIKDNGAIIITATQPFATEVINSNRKCFRYDLIWEKSLKVGFANSHKMPLRKHELILVFYKHLPTYNPQGLIKLDKPKETKNPHQEKSNIYHKGSLNSSYITVYKNYPHSILNFPQGNNKTIHPTQKPLALWEYLIKTYSNEGDTVLDPFGGSGTTAVAAINTNRNYIVYEKDEEYFRLAVERIGK